MRFAIATRDELWIHGALVESRLSHGEALQRGREIVASDVRDEELVAACTSSLEIPVADRVRVVVSARRIGEHRVDSTTFAITRNGFSTVWTAATACHPERAGEWARRIPSGNTGRAPSAGDPSHPHHHPLRMTSGRRSPNLVWRNGSAAVLLHEAIGHAAEHEHAPIAWPAWLSVHDEPASVDDCGNPPRVANLLQEPPASMRRESFRDIPLRRMSNLVARGNAPFDLPKTRIEIHLVEGGHYEPLTETVSLRIAAADFVDGGEVLPIAPFDLVATREEIARALKGATGDPIEYPGVICSAEGQELFVGSFAPLMLTVFE